MSNKKHHSHDHPHEEKEPKKTAEMKKPETPNDDALFSDEPAFPKESKSEAKPDKIGALEAEVREANDRTLRAHAELDNYRKRAVREMEDVRKYASIDLIRDLLPVWDNLGRALEAAEKNHDLNPLIEGVRMMYEQFVKVLNQHHCERIEAVGQPFDPNVHESISLMPSDVYPPGTVTHETQIGFKLYDRVVRPTQVVLASEK